MPRSHCPDCGYQLKWYENIPILSYIFLKATCSKCKTKIPITYPIVESIVGVLGILILEHCSSLQEYFFILILSGIAVALGFIDIKHHRLPHALTYTGILFVIFYGSMFSNPFYDSIWAFRSLPESLALVATSLSYLGLSFFVVDALTHTANLFYFKEKALRILSSGLSFRNEFLNKHITWIYLLLTAVELFLAYQYPMTIFFWFNLALGVSYLVNEICIDYIFTTEHEEIEVEAKDLLTVFGGGDASFLALIVVVLGLVPGLLVFVAACYIALSQVMISKIKSHLAKSDQSLAKYIPLGGGLAFAFIAAMMILNGQR